MKMRFPIVLSALLTAFAVCGANAQAPLAPDPAKLKLASANVLVLDAQSGQPLYSKGAEEVTPIASLTKLMTAIVTIESGLPLTTLESTW
jgi:D-alanyl-D-alanine endopeptidase (penicillin-binding protein 7)